MKRGEIWTVASGGGYLAKPRPVAIVQDNRFDATESVTVCALTTDPTEAPLFRLVLRPSVANGLNEISSLMVDKITTIKRMQLGRLVGELGRDEVLQLDRAMMVFLGLGG